MWVAMSPSPAMIERLEAANPGGWERLEARPGFRRGPTTMPVPAGPSRFPARPLKGLNRRLVASRPEDGTFLSTVGRLIDELLKRGSITIVTPDGNRQTHGPGGRVADRAPRRPQGRIRYYEDPRLGLGEAYMDSRLTVEDSASPICFELVTGSVRWEDGKGKVIGKGKLAAIKAFSVATSRIGRAQCRSPL